MATINYSMLTPEQALKMYEDYVTSDEHNENKALRMLFDYLTSYQQRIRKPNYWDTTDTSVAGNIQYLYKLMIAYIELRLDEGLNGTEEQNQLKEVFKSYRQMTQNQHPEAFIDVLEEYRDKVEKLFDSKVQAYPIEELQKLPFVGQLSYEETAEDLLFMSFDPEIKNQKDQMKSTLRILWEAYRTIMENVKWNEKMEDIYFDTLRKIADFCLKYKRKGELQWCVDQINRFVGDLNSKEIDLKKNPWHVDLTKPQTNDKHVSIRFELVLTAMELEMWNEAYKMLETILVLKSMRKGIFRTSYMLQYYEFLTKIFKQSQNTLYQAFAYYNHFLAYKKKPVKTPNEMKAKNDEINKKLNYLVLNILVIPIVHQEQIHKDTVSTLFGKGTTIPSRDEMLQIISEMNVLDFVSPTIRKVYNLVEAEQDLLTVSSIAQQCFHDLVAENKDYEQFIPLLEENLILKVLKAASIIFNTLKFQSLYKMLSFIPQKKIQQILLYSNVNGTLDCRVDFLAQIIRFNQQTNQSVLFSIISQFQKVAQDAAAPPQKSKDEVFSKGKNYLEASRLWLVTRQQIIKQLHKLSDPNKLKKEWDQKIAQDKKEQERINKEEESRRKWENQKQLEMEQMKEQELKVRWKLLQDIIKLKGGKYVTFEINGEKKKIENLKDFQLEQIDTQVLKDIKKQLEEESKKTADDKYVRAFKRVEYMERERKAVGLKKLQEQWDDSDELVECQQKHKERYEKNIQQKKQLIDANKFKEEQVKQYIKKQNDEYDSQLAEWKTKLKEYYYDQVVKLAEELKKQDEEEKQRKLKEEEELRKLREEKEKEEQKRQQTNREGWRSAQAQNQPQKPKTESMSSAQFADQALSRNANAVTPTPTPAPVAAQASATIQRGAMQRNQNPPEQAKPQVQQQPQKPIQFTRGTNVATTAQQPPQQQQQQQKPAQTGFGLQRNQGQPQQPQAQKPVQQQPQPQAQKPQDGGLLRRNIK